MKKTKIIIADDHSVLRQGLKAVFAEHPGFSVVGEAENGLEAIQKAGTLKPDVVIMDITMPELNGITATKRLSEEHPDVRVIILSMHADIYNAIEAFRAGALGYVLKDSPPEELLLAVDKVMAGAKYASPAVTGELLNDFVEIIKRDQSGDPYDQLSQREKEVLRLIADGETSKEIADKLFISLSTVKTHRNNLMRKLSVNDMAGLIRIAIKKGVVKSG